ncbi:DUF2986 domain-containing protein [Marinomonas sp. THO17]|uniref:DUF2986 domain-containing protein n=1 Tax=Marinomonas sp. THO17 TaxID=3149048 RepID=UPI00336C0B49
MNRRKKIKSILTKKAKQANQKANPKNKPKYISKADRAKLAAQANQTVTPEVTSNETTTPGE